MNDLTTFGQESMLDSSKFEQLQRVAKLYSQSGMVPKTFENNMPACFVGLQLAFSMRVDPFLLFQKLYTIGGKIGIETQAAVAIANQKGVFDSPITHEFSGQGKNRTCTAKAVLARNKQTVSITLDWNTVEAEGWDKKMGSKWKTMPDQMFRYRTSMWLIRTYAPEVLLGLYSTDELEDSKIIDVTPKKVKKIDAAFEELKEEPKQIQTEEIKVIEEPKEAEIIKPDRRAQIIEFGINPSSLTAYIVRSVKKNIPFEELDDSQIETLYQHIVATKKGNK